MNEKFHTKFSLEVYIVHVTKRDGTIVPFDSKKIINAINKAFIEVDGELYENDTATDIALEIGRRVDGSITNVTVETI